MHARDSGNVSRRRSGHPTRQDSRPKQHHGGGSVSGGASSVGSDSTYSRALNSTRTAAAERALFLAVYSMLSSNSLKDKISTLAFIVEPIQLLATNFAITAVVAPALAFDANTQVVSSFIAETARLASNPFTGSNHFPTSLIDFWICMALTLATLITFGYVGYKLSFSSTSPETALLALRIVAMVEATVLFMPNVEVFMRYMLIHSPNGSDHPVEYIAFPGEAVDVGLVIGSWLLFVVFFPCCVIIATVAVDVQGVFGQSHGRAELSILVIKLLLVLTVQMTPVMGIIAAAFIKFFLSLVLLWTMLRFMPYNVLIANQFRAGGIAMFVYVSIVEVAAAINLIGNSAGDFFLLGVIPAAMFGSYLAARRWHSVTNKMPSAGRLWEMVEQEDRYDRVLSGMLVLDTPTDLDIAVRHVLTASNEMSGYIRDKNDLGILRALGWRVGSESSGSAGHDDSDAAQSLGGLRRGPDVAQVDGRLLRMGSEERYFLVHWLYQRAAAEQGDTSRLWTAYFNFVHWGNTGSRMRMSAAALARINSLDLRFAVFRYLFEKRRSQVGQGQSTVRYLDLSKSMRTATVYHSKAFREIKTFWKTLIQQGSRITLDKVRSSLHRIGVAERLASAAFAGLVSKHSYSTQVLRSYATFLTQVRNNPVEAQRFIAMADGVEEEAAAERAATLSHQLGRRQSSGRSGPQRVQESAARSRQHGGGAVRGGDDGAIMAVTSGGTGLRPFGAAAHGSGSGSLLDDDTGDEEGGRGDSGPGGSGRPDALGLDAPAGEAAGMPKTRLGLAASHDDGGANVAVASSASRMRMHRAGTGVASLLKHEAAVAAAGSEGGEELADSQLPDDDDGGDVDSTEAVDPDAGGGLAAELSGRADLGTGPAASRGGEESGHEDILGAQASTAAKGDDVIADSPSDADGAITPLASFGGATGLVAGSSNADTVELAAAASGNVDGAEAGVRLGADESRGIPVRSAMRRVVYDNGLEGSWGGGFSDANGNEAAPTRARRVSIALGDGTVVTPGVVVQKAVENAARGGERVETALYGAALEAVARDTMGEDAEDELLADDDDLMSDAGDEFGGFDQDGMPTRKRRRRRVHTIGTAEVESEETTPRTWPGIRSFRFVLGLSVIGSLLFVSLPIGINLNLLRTLRAASGAAATGARREMLLWMSGSMLADMEGGRYWSVYDSAAAGLPNNTLAPSLAELAGELLHVNYRLIFCNSPADALSSYYKFAQDQSLLSCPTGVSSTESVTTDITGVSYDVASDNSGTSPAAATGSDITVVSLPRLADELAQQIQYQLLTASQVPIDLSPQIYEIFTPQFNTQFAASLANMTPTEQRAAVEVLQRRSVQTEQELQASISFLYNLFSTANTMAEATRVLEEESNRFDQQFLVVLVAITVLSVISFAMLPCILLRGLFHAHFEQMLGWYILEAVPKVALMQALRTADGESEDEVTEATDMKRVLSFDDVAELRQGESGGGGRQTGKNKPGVSRYGTLGYDLNPESVIARAMRKIERRVCEGFIHVKRKLPSLVRLTSQIRQSRRSLGQHRMAGSGAELEWGDAALMGRAASDGSVDGSGLHQYRLSDSDRSGMPLQLAGSLKPGPATTGTTAMTTTRTMRATTIIPVGTAVTTSTAPGDGVVSPGTAVLAASAAASVRAVGTAEPRDIAPSGGGLRGNDSKVVPKLPPIEVAGSAPALAVGQRRTSDATSAAEAGGCMGRQDSGSTWGGGFTPREGREGHSHFMAGTQQQQQQQQQSEQQQQQQSGGRGPKARRGWFGRSGRPVDPLVAVLNALMKASEHDPAYRKSSKCVIKIGALLVVLVVTCMVVLITSYAQVVMINRQFNAMGRYLTAYTRSGFEASVRRARASNQTTWATLINAQTGRLVFDPWYVDSRASSGDGTLEASVQSLREMAELLEHYHRCVVFGCSALPLNGVAIDGVSTSATIAEWFFGVRAIDRAFRTYTSQLRNSPDTVSATYESNSFGAVRALPRLYSELWEQWANTYFISSIVIMVVLVAAVLAVAVYYAKTFLFDTTYEVREWRFILGLLPPGVLAKIPLGLSFMTTTEWSMFESNSDADDFNIIDDEDQQI